MGLLVNGEWQDRWYDTTSTGGRFVRKDAAFRNWVTPRWHGGAHWYRWIRAEPGRYHLYVSLACPWAHRTLIMRQLKGLEDMISLSVVHWLMHEELDLCRRPWGDTRLCQWRTRAASGLHIG
jgi:putative glutathione S-transferase